MRKRKVVCRACEFYFRADDNTEACPNCDGTVWESVEHDCESIAQHCDSFDEESNCSGCTNTGEGYVEHSCIGG